MKMSPADIKKYPKLVYYIKNNVPKIINVPIIVSAMNKIGQINLTNLRIALAWGMGPQIRIANLGNASGEFTPNTKTNEIRLNKKLVEDFEKGKGIRKARAGKVYLVGVTLLHELIHWGDDQDGIDRPGEEGEEFERLVYGSVIY